MSLLLWDRSETARVSTPGDIVQAKTNHKPLYENGFRQPYILGTTLDSWPQWEDPHRGLVTHPGALRGGLVG